MKKKSVVVIALLFIVFIIAQKQSLIYERAVIFIHTFIDVQDFQESNRVAEWTLNAGSTMNQLSDRLLLSLAPKKKITDAEKILSKSHLYIKYHDGFIVYIPSHVLDPEKNILVFWNGSYYLAETDKEHVQAIYNFIS